MGRIRLPISIQGVKYDEYFLVTDTLAAELIIGRQFLSRNSISLHFSPDGMQLIPGRANIATNNMTVSPSKNVQFPEPLASSVTEDIIFPDLDNQDNDFDDQTSDPVWQCESPQFSDTPVAEFDNKVPDFECTDAYTPPSYDCHDSLLPDIRIKQSFDKPAQEFHNSHDANKDKKVEFVDNTVETIIQDTQSSSKIEKFHNGRTYRIYNKETTLLNPGEKTVLKVQMFCPPKEEKKLHILQDILPRQLHKKLLVLDNETCQQRDFSLTVVNISTAPQKIKDKIALAWAIDVTHINAAPIVTAIVDNIHIDCSNLTTDQKERVLNMVNSIPEIFSASNHDLGCLKDYKYSITVTSEKPVSIRNRRLPFFKEAFYEAIIQDLLKADIIQVEQTSPYCSPAILVPKSDGKQRLVIDYRQLNTHILDEPSILPRPLELLAQVRGNVFFSTLDLAQGYYQILLDENSRKYTTFSSGDSKLYSFKRLPMGLRCAANCFARCITQALDDYVGKICLVYLDDILVFGKSFEDHLQNLFTIFKKLRELNLKLKPSKCNLFVKECHFLGHKITANSIQPQFKKLDVVARLPSPTDKRELQSVLGFLTYHQSYIQNFAEIAAPLYKLLNKRTEFSWGPLEEASLQKLKDLLLENPRMGIADLSPESGEMILDCDCSTVAMGYCLAQIQQGQEIPLAFASKCLKPSQKHWCSYKLEIAAIFEGLKKFQHYLLGKHFILRTDHKPLLSLQKKGNLSGMYARHADFISQFDFRVIHRPGKLHTNADFMSRLRPCCLDDCPECLLMRKQKTAVINQVTAIDMNPFSFETLVQEQANDTDIALLRDIILSNAQPTIEEIQNMPDIVKRLLKLRDRLTIIHDILHIKLTNSDPSVSSVPIATEALIPRILNFFHSPIITGNHSGFNKTLQKIKRAFFWPNMARDVFQFTASCIQCQESQTTYVKNRHPLLALRPEGSLSHIQMDIVGPILASADNHKYILTIQDIYSKFARAIPLREISAKTVASKLVKHWITIFGPPKILHTDRAQNFVSTLLNEVCQLLSIEKRINTAFHPQTTGSIERFHRTLSRILAHYCDIYPDDWNKMLPLCVMGYHATPHSSHSLTPYEVIYGKPMNLPHTALVEEFTENKDVTQYTANLQDKLLTIYELVGKTRETYQTRMKKAYDKRAKDQPLNIGDEVLLKNDKAHMKGHKKFQKKYIEGFIVTQRVAEYVYKIRNKYTDKVLVVNRDKLRPLFTTEEQRIIMENSVESAFNKTSHDNTSPSEEVIEEHVFDDIA